MSRVSELQKEKDQRLEQMHNDFRSRMDQLESDKEDIKSKAQEKANRGENISAEVEQYREKNALQGREVDWQKQAGDQVATYYDEQIKDAEAQEENDNGYGM